jgi:hypothetical protein
MYETVQNCNHCGANLTLADLRNTNCPYCKTVLPHHAQAAQHAAVAGQVMNQMMAQQAAIQNQWRAGFGVGPMPQGPPGGPPPGMPYAGYGAPPPPPGMPGNPYAGAYGNPAAMVQAQMDAANKVTRNVFVVVGVIVGVSVLLTVLTIVAVALR